MHPPTAMERLRTACALALVALLALPACAEDDDAAADLATPDASTVMTQVFTIEQPAAPALQQLINSCASGFDAASCQSMCRAVLCPFVMLPTLDLLACTLSRKGPIATVTVTYVGPFTCPPPPPGGFPAGLP